MACVPSLLALPAPCNQAPKADTGELHEGGLHNHALQLFQRGCNDAEGAEEVAETMFRLGQRVAQHLQMRHDMPETRSPVDFVCMERALSR